MKAVFLWALVALVVPHVAAVVIGIDFGHKWTKVAIVKPGMPLEVVLNVESKRKTPNYVTVYENETYVGDSAVAMLGRRPETILGKTQRLLGQPWDSELVNLYRETMVAPLVQDERGLAAFTFEDGTLSVEAVTALLLKQAKANAERFADVHVKDCVITVPVFFTQRERLAILDAAELAGLNVLSLINDNVAVAVNYGVLRTIDETPEKPRRVLFYDMGAGSTKVSYVEFYSTVTKSTKKKNTTVSSCDVKAVHWDRALGGEVFEERLLQAMADQFNSQKNFKGDVRTNQRAMARLRGAAEKAKHVLSANTETPVNVGSLMDDVDYKGFFTRAEFEEASKDIFERVTEPIQKVLDDAQVTIDDIEEVVLVGGGARIPKIQEHLKTFFNRPALDKNINADEAAVLGAAFYGATMSAAFRVKAFKIKDATPFAVGVTFDTRGSAVQMEDALDEGDMEEAMGSVEEDDGEASTKTTRLFKLYNKVPSKKLMTFKRTEDFSFSVDYLDGDLMPSPLATHLGTYEVTGVKEAIEAHQERFMEGTEPRVKVSFRLDPNGIVHVLKAELTYNESVVEELKKTKKSGEKDSGWFDKASDFFFGDKEGDNEGDKKGDKEGDKEGVDGATGDDAVEEGEGAEAGGAADSGDGAEDNTAEAPKEEDEAAPKEEDEAAPAEEKTEEAEPAGEKEEESSEKEAAGQADPEGGDSETASTEEEEGEKEEEEEPKTIVKIKSRKVKLVVNATTAAEGMSKEQKKETRSVLLDFQERDAERKAIAKARNELESASYAVREQMYEEDFDEASTEEEREHLTEHLTGLDDWLDYEVEGATLDQLSERMNDLKNLTRDIFMRISEMKTRPKDVERLKETLEMGKQMSMEWKAETVMSLAEDEDPRLTEENLKDLDDMIEEVSQWLEEKEAEQSELKAYENPAFLSYDIHDKGEPLARKLTYFTRKPKPVQKKKKHTPPPLTPVPEATDDNDPPVFTTPAVMEGTVNKTYEFAINVTDVDDDDKVTVTSEELPEWMTLEDHGNHSATLSGVPTKHGKNKVVLLATDVAGLVDRMEFTVVIAKGKTVEKPKKKSKSKKSKSKAKKNKKKKKTDDEAEPEAEDTTSDEPIVETPEEEESTETPEAAQEDTEEDSSHNEL